MLSSPLTLLRFLRGVININFTPSQISLDCCPALLLGPFFGLNLRHIITYNMLWVSTTVFFGVIAYRKLVDVDRDMLGTSDGFSCHRCIRNRQKLLMPSSNVVRLNESEYLITF